MKAQDSLHTPFPIDLVYMWVDGDDPVWRAKREKYIGGNTSQSRQTTTEARWRNNDELRYSLRSVEMYAPWINHIFIITDNQRPEWLDVDNPKITIIDHTQIFPAEALPTYNSTAIESRIYKIPGLSEHFLLGNDDTFFSAPVTPDMFFTEDGRSIVRLRKFNRIKWVGRGNYTRMLWHMQELAYQLTGKMVPYTPHHNIDSYRKSDIEHCVSLFKEEWERTAYSRFRKDDDMHRSFIAYYTIATGKAVKRMVRFTNGIKGIGGFIRAILTNRYAMDSYRIRANKSDYNAVMRKFSPLMICVNDSERVTEDDCRRMVEFLNQMYPHKSSFEK